MITNRVIVICPAVPCGEGKPSGRFDRRREREPRPLELAEPHENDDQGGACQQGTKFRSIFRRISYVITVWNRFFPLSVLPILTILKS